MDSLRHSLAERYRHVRAATEELVAPLSAEHQLLRPLPAPADATGPAQLFGDGWEWTASAHSRYPSSTPAAGALGEYNGRFMVGHQVLRGGSCFTPRGHIRPGYRNFFPPATRIQVTGARLAKDL